MINNSIYSLSSLIGVCLKNEKKTITCAESCTGGWLAKSLTDIPGSTNWFEYGFVTYGNQSKFNLLGVKIETLLQYGAISDPVVMEMAHGALKIANADYAIAISGVAGPNSGILEKPIGTVWFGFSTLNDKSFSKLMYFTGSRKAIRFQAVHFALSTLIKTFFTIYI